MQPEGSPRSRKPANIVFIGIATLLVILVVAYALVRSPLSPGRMCTMMACFDTLEISFNGRTLEEYTVTVTSDGGEVRDAACSPGRSGPHYLDASPDLVVCTGEGVIFENYSPREVKIEITWQGGSYITSAIPNYEDFRPNGPGCDPVCQVATIEVVLP